MNSQNASLLWMIKPKVFGFNVETASTNFFQQSNVVNGNALAEFDAMVDLLIANKIDVFVSCSEDVSTVDALFPNNWIAFLNDKSQILFPMLSVLRRKERGIAMPFESKSIVDLTHYEHQNMFFEGTGSMVIDHIHKTMFVSISERSNLDVAKEVAKLLQMNLIYFSSFDLNQQAVYHTNVMMHIGDRYVVICLDAIHDDNERKSIVHYFNHYNFIIIEISKHQMHNFAGNMLQVVNSEVNKITVVSSTAYNSLTDEQIELLNENTKLLVCNIPTIEHYGGGSVRCMLAEIF